MQLLWNAVVLYSSAINLLMCVDGSSVLAVAGWCSNTLPSVVTVVGALTTCQRVGKTFQPNTNRTTLGDCQFLHSRRPICDNFRTATTRHDACGD